MPGRLDLTPTIAARTTVHPSDAARTPVVLLGASVPDLCTYQRHLPLAFGGIALTSPELAAVVARVAECIVIADGGTTDLSTLESVTAELRSANPALAIVCATRRPDWLTRLQNTGFVDEVLEFDAPVSALHITIEGARTGALLRRTAHAVALASGFPVTLRDILIRLLVRTPPLRSVREACTDGAVNRRTLWYQWDATIDQSAITLHGVVAWILVLRASMLRARGYTWHDAATRLGVHRRTLARAVRERGFVMNPDPWDDLADGVHSALRQGFRHNVVRHLVAR